MDINTNTNWNVRYDLSPVQKYKFTYSMLLASVPLICITILTLLIIVFAKLNLYYLETKGLIVNPIIRDAYYGQVLMEVGSVSWYFLLLIVVTFSLSWLVMGWATSPFVNAQKLLLTALHEPEKLKNNSQWLSESVSFDKIFWSFAEQIKYKKFEESSDQAEYSAKNAFSTLPFLGKYIAIFSLLSIMTGYIMGIFFSTIYSKVVSISMQFSNALNVIHGHYFLAQEEVLSDAVTLMIVLSFVSYLLIGRAIGNYMSTMIYVFCRSVKERNFPLILRQRDIYHPLAEVLNTAFQLIPENDKSGEQIQK